MAARILEAFWLQDQMREYFHAPGEVACTDGSCIKTEVQVAKMHVTGAGIAYRQGNEPKIATKSHAVTGGIG